MMKKQKITDYCREHGLMKYYHRLQERIYLKHLTLEDALKDIEIDGRTKALGRVKRIKYFIKYEGKTISLADASNLIIKKYDLPYKPHNIQSNVYHRMRIKNETTQQAFEHVVNLYQRKYRKEVSQ